ncbi:MAG: sugar phosphate nucleotidyltransferase [Promethearchaeota archaeon]
MESKSNTCVIVLAAGFATRLRPFSNKIPKPLIDINGKTLLSRIISNFKEAGFNRFCFVLGYKKEFLIKEILKEKDIETILVKQKEPTGMADAIALTFKKILRKYRDITDFFITAADIIVSKAELWKMYKLYEYCDIVLSLMKSNELEIARSHGNVKLDRDSDLSKDVDANQGLKIIDIIEKPKPHQIMSMYYSLPLYLTNKKIMQFMENLEISERGEKEFQDVLKNAFLNNLDIRGIRIVSPLITTDNIGKFHLTSLRDIIKMNKRFLTGLNLSPFEGKKPNCLEPLKIGNQNLIGDNVTLGPHVIIGNSCNLGDFSQLTNSILYNNITLGKSCVLDWCIIDDGVTLPDKLKASDCFIKKDNEKDFEIINF